MKILFFTPLPKWPIHVGVQLDEIIEWQKKGHEIIYVYNNCCYNGLCSANMSADTSECMLCKFDVFHMLKLVPKGVKKVNLNSFWPKDLDVHFQYNNVDELKKIEYKGVKTGYSVLSTYITATRNLAPLIDASSRPFFDRLLLQSCKLTDAFEKILDKYHPDRVCFYNARLLEQRPEYDLARKRNIETYSYEVYAGVEEPFYKTKYINVTPHNVESLHIRYQKLWDETDLSLTEKEKIGRAYFSKKRAGIAVGDKVYIASQTKGKLPQNWNENVENIVIFNSSEDEFSALGDEFDKLALFPSQYKGITFIANELKDNPNVRLWLRIHPNLTSIPYRYHTELHKLPQLYSNITVIAGDDDVSTYDLMEAADKVIVFGSTVGLESAYWKKPVILLAGAIYYYSDICYVPHTPDELAEFLHEKLTTKNNIEAIKIGFYFNYRNNDDLYKSIDFNKETIVIGKHRWFEVFHYLKIFNSYKLYTIIKRFAYWSIFSRRRHVNMIPRVEDTLRDL